MALIILQILFWSALFALLHTYLFYPLLVIYFARNKKNNTNVYGIEELPAITIIMAVRNEEKVIEDKLESVVCSNYPKDKITFFVGSDASDDNTDHIINTYAQKYSFIRFKRFDQRSGKIKIINELSANVLTQVLIFTDANAIFSEDAIFQLVKHFKEPKIKVVGGRLQNRKTEKKDVAFQEHTYMEGEFKVKIAEGKLWGSMMGAYGAFYAIRKEAFVRVPKNFIVDDFYISLKAIEKEGKAICDPKAIAYEDVPGDLKSEFRRKTRISTGNFQNLAALFPALFFWRFSLAFSFFSHKILRWLGPVFLLILFISSITLFNTNKIYATTLIIMSLSLAAPIIDFFHRKSQIQILILRFITHFYYMNTALFIGLINYLKGVKTNVWEPTKR